MGAGLRLAITREMPPLDPALDAEVDRLWAIASTRATLFNGRIFCADRVTPNLIEGHWTEYRRLTAQMADHSLLPRLRVHSLAVCGVVLGPDGVAVGRREPRASYQPGLWQLPPAGSVDSGSALPGGADWRHALHNELREELALREYEVHDMRPLCLVQHPSGVLDLGVQIDTELRGPEILARQRTAPDQEYDSLFVAPPEDIPAEVAARGGELVPPAYAFLRRIH
ncbi:MAG: hypothetical protein ACRYGM_11080 [Janthinobacterium lividum]